MRSEIKGNDPVSLSTREYFRARLRHRLYDLVIREFEQSGGTRAHLAKRLSKHPEQITRWLSSPGNLTLDTLSDLLLGLSGGELAMWVDYPANKAAEHYRMPDALRRAHATAFNKKQVIQNVTATESPMQIAATDATIVITSTMKSLQGALVEIV